MGRQKKEKKGPCRDTVPQLDGTVLCGKAKALFKTKTKCHLSIKGHISGNVKGMMWSKTLFNKFQLICIIRTYDIE